MSHDALIRLISQAIHTSLISMLANITTPSRLTRSSFGSAQSSLLYKWIGQNFSVCWQLCSCLATANMATSIVLIMGFWGTHSLWTLASLCNLSTLKPQWFTWFRVLMLLFLKICILQDKMPCHWESGFWHFEEPQCLHLQDPVVPYLTTLHNEGSMSFKTPETTHAAS